MDWQELIDMVRVPADDVLVIGAVLTGLAALGFWIDTTPLGKRTSGVVWLILAATLLSNVGLIPMDSPVYGAVHAYLVPLAIPLLLFKADLRRVWREAGPVLAAFGVAVVAVCVGAVVGDLAVGQGALGHKLAGVFAAAWIGGAVGFVGAAEALRLSHEEYAVAIGASNIVSILGLLALLALPALGTIRRLVPSRIMADSSAAPASASAPTAVRLDLVHLSASLAASFAICAVAHLVTSRLEIPGLPNLKDYNILVVTALAILVANLLPRTFARVQGEFEVGMYFLYVFFAAIGAGTNATEFITGGPLVLVHALILLAVFLVLLVLISAALRIDLARAVIGGAAAFVGVAPTAAIASARGWTGLVVPGIMCALLGKISGTFIGVALARLLLG